MKRNTITFPAVSRLFTICISLSTLASAVGLDSLDNLLEIRIAADRSAVLDSLALIPVPGIDDRLSLGGLAGIGWSTDPSLGSNKGAYTTEMIRADFRLLPSVKRISRSGDDSAEIILSEEKVRENLLQRLYRSAISYNVNCQRIAILNQLLETEKTWGGLVDLREREGFLLSRDQEEFRAGFLIHQRNRSFAISAKDAAAEQICILTGVRLQSEETIDLTSLSGTRSKEIRTDSILVTAERNRLQQEALPSPITLSVGAAISSSQWFETGTPGINSAVSFNLTYYPGINSERKRIESQRQFSLTKLSFEEKHLREERELLRSEIRQELTMCDASVQFASETVEQTKRAWDQAKSRAASLVGDQKEKELQAQFAYYRACLDQCDMFEKREYARAKAVMYSPDLLSQKSLVSTNNGGRIALVWNGKELQDSITLVAMRKFGITGIALSFTSQEIERLKQVTSADSLTRLLDSIQKSGVDVSFLVGDPLYLNDTESLKQLLQFLEPFPHDRLFLDLEPSQLSPEPSKEQSNKLILNAVLAGKGGTTRPVIPLIHSSLVTSQFIDELSEIGVNSVSAMVYRNSEAAILSEVERILTISNNVELFAVISAEPASVIGTPSALVDRGVDVIDSTLNHLDALAKQNHRLQGTMIQSLHYLAEVKK